VKLSPRDKQRLQWALAILVGGGALVYVFVIQLILPLTHSKVQNLALLAKYKDDGLRDMKDLRSLTRDKEECAKLWRELNTITNRFVIRPVLGSTKVTVQSIVEPLAAECGLVLESVDERGQSEVPVNKKAAPLTMDRYLLEISAVGSFAAARDFVTAIEKTNEFVCVSDVEISGREGTPDKHKVRICMEWPVVGEVKVVEPPPSRGRRGTE
jgi:hypothetical protein